MILFMLAQQRILWRLAFYSVDGGNRFRSQGSRFRGGRRLGHCSLSPSNTAKRDDEGRKEPQRQEECADPTQDDETVMNGAPGGLSVTENPTLQAIRCKGNKYLG